MFSMHRAALAVVSACFVAGAFAQFPQLVTDFETDGTGQDLIIQPGSIGDLEVVVFQDPAEADVTTANVLDDGSAVTSDSSGLRSTEESFVASFTADGFFGANGSDNFLDVRFEWATLDATRWALLETLQSPTLGDPSLHLGGKVSFYVNIPDCAQFEYPGLFTLPSEIGVALLISETGQAVPQGFQDFDVLNGAFEFVGVSSVAAADTENPVPVPSTFVPLTDPDCLGANTGPSGDWRLVEIDLSTANVVGWSARGGDGVLDATGAGVGVNRGVLAGIVLAVPQTDTTSDFVEFLIDQIEFEAPVNDPPTAPSIAAPVVENDTEVQINDVVARATSVVLEIDRSDADNTDEFVADETVSTSPGLSPSSEDRFVVITGLDPLVAGDRVRARQVVGGVTGPDSLIIAVNPPAVFTATLALDEDGSLGTAAVFEWVGAASVQGGQPVGKPVFPQNGVWQKLEYSLVPGVEPVVSFAGGNGQLEPNGGLYNIDSMFFTIDSTEPSTGPYDLFIDRVYYIDADGNENIISNAEVTNPFAGVRGQSTAINNSSVLSSVAAFDGVQSNRHQWEFPDTSAGNAYSPFRPAVTFPDSALAVGMWILVEDPRESALPLPEIDGPVVGDAPLVTVTNIDPGAQSVELFVNGVSVASVDPAGASSVDIDPGITLELLDSISAQYTTSEQVSDFAYPVGVQAPSAPAIQPPLVEGQGAVTVTGILNAPGATASLVSLYADGVLIASVDPAGAASAVLTVNPPLALGEQIAATQTVNGIESPPSANVAVGTGEVLCVVINEFQYEEVGFVGDREYIELYNAGSSAQDISGWLVRASDTVGPPADDNPDYVIPANTILAAGDYWVIGDASVPNVDQVETGDLLEGGVDAIELLDENGVVVDTVIYERNKGAVAVSPAEGGIWGNFQSFDDSPTAIGRWYDGFDTDDNGRDFALLPVTPGAPNNPLPVSPFTDNFSGAAGTTAANFSGSFVPLTQIDPTVADAFNPNPIAASPQGGNAAICWDPSGGGNQCGLIDEARFNVGFSAQIYIDTDSGFGANDETGEFEEWSIGLGTVMTFHNSFTGTANGNTGLMWQYLKVEDGDTGTVGSVSLQLVDRNNGGTDGTVLLDIDPAELTTGWHTISIERNYENVTASFNAEVYNGVIAANGPSTLQMGYFEALSDNAGTRPPTIDNLIVTEPAPPTLGASCSPCGCTLLTAAVSGALGQSYAGDGTDCTDADNNGVADACEALTAPKPVVEGPICTVDRLVAVSNVAAEAAEVRVLQDGGLVLGTATPSGADTIRVVLDVLPALGSEVTAVQTVGSEDSVQSDAVVVEDCTFTCETLFTDDFDLDTATEYVVVVESADTAVTFNYDYGADGVPAAPSSAGTTLGLKMEANLSDGATDIVSVAPIGVTPAGDYVMTVEYWINFATAGSGTTEFIGGGVAFDGLTPDHNGVTHIASGEGGSGFRDYRPFAENALLDVTDVVTELESFENLASTTLQQWFPAQPVPEAQGQTGQGFDGGQAFAWRTLVFRVDRALETVTITIDGFEIATVACGGELGATCNLDGLVRMMYVEVFASIASEPEFQFGLFDNLVVEELCEVGGGDLIGDSNCDGTVDFFDIDPFVTALVSGQAVWETQFDCDFAVVNDINEDGVVDFFDIDPFVALLVGG